MNITGIRIFAALILAAAASSAQAGLLFPWPSVPATITSTFLITQNTKLANNVSCQTVGEPCLQFAAPDITLDLNGFIVVGGVVPGACAAGPVANEDAINSGGQSNIRIQGPGFVRLFRGVGIDVTSGSGVAIESVIVATHCGDGILLNAGNSSVQNNVVVRNSGNAVQQGGGIAVIGDGNFIAGNEISGNGVEQGAPFGPIDFGIGVFGSRNNIFGNSALGNTPNGIVIDAAAASNAFVNNRVIGNPAIAVAALQGGHSQGVDIRDLGTGTSNTFTDNLCGNGLNSPCPNVPNFAGHGNLPAPGLLGFLFDDLSKK